MSILKTTFLAAALALVAASSANAMSKKSIGQGFETVYIDVQAPGSRAAQESLNW